MIQNKKNTPSGSGFLVSVIIVFLFFVFASFYSTKDQENAHYECNMNAETNSSDNVQQFFPGLWQIAY